jgi:hypothetical protein
MRGITIHVITVASSCSRLTPRVVARDQTLSPATTSSSMVVVAPRSTRWVCTSFFLYSAWLRCSVPMPVCRV